MISLLLCVLAAFATFAAANRRLVLGLVVLLAVGYLYGIVRANVTQTFSHFIFDGAVAGLYASVFRGRASAAAAWRTSLLRPWMLLLIGWPLLLMLLPVQDPLVQLVGLRGAIFLVPFTLIGARLNDSDMAELAQWVAALNIAAFGVAVAEFFLGIELFFPRNAVTELIYRSRDVAGATEHRIPSTFTSAHAYAGSMALSSALIIGVWMERGTTRKWLLGAGVVASMIGIFMAAARTHMLVVALLVVAATLSGRVTLSTRLAWIVPIALSAFVVAQSERMQRFRSLQDTDYVAERIQGSVNESFLDLAQRYPMGVGLGGGGTSLPYFLQERVRERVLMENEYARIMLEQGVPGLVAWICFVFWAFSQRRQRRATQWQVTARLMWIGCAAYFGTSLTGTGLLTAVPLTAFLLLFVGWLCAVPLPASLAAAASASPSAGSPDVLPSPVAAMTRRDPMRP